MVPRRNKALEVVWRLHRAVLRASRGRVGTRIGGLPVLLLTTTGRRSGEPRTVALSYLDHGDGHAVVASNAGDDRPPAWWLNLQADPQATVEIRGVRRAMRARRAEGAEHDEVWQAVVAANADFAAYRERTERDIPVVVLEPRDGEPPHPRPDMAAWQPPADPGLVGRFAENDRLAAAELWPVPGRGPEDVVVDADGRVYTGLEDGRIVRFPARGGSAEVVADTGGRPLGLEIGPDGRLVVCDARRGLLRLAPGGGVTPLVTRVGGRRLRFTNNAAVAGDGTIYFSDSSTRFGIDRYRDDILEHRPNGRLLACGPGGEGARVVLDGLYFANGVALAPDESFVLVAETGAYRIRRVWLTGERAGTDDVFAANLPGIPDNLATGPSGVVWAAMFTPRNPVLDRLLPRPRLRAATALLPERLQPQPARHGLVLGFHPDGRLADNLQDPGGGYAPITGVREHDGWLYLGSLTERAVARVRLG